MTPAGIPDDSNLQRGKLRSKIGGNPVGIGEEAWPRCGQCGDLLDFLVQLDLHHPWPLSERFRWAFLFFCRGYHEVARKHRCQSYYPWGANRIVLLEEAATDVSPDPPEVTKYAEFDLRFVDREEHDELRLAAQQEFMESMAAAGDIVAKGEEDVEIVMPPALSERQPILQLGGTADWIQQDETPNCPICGGAMHLLTQIEETQEAGGPHFKVGVVYAFLCDADCSPDGHYLMFQVD